MRKHWSEDAERMIAIVVGFLLAVIVCSLVGCASAPCECPPILPPEVVEIPVYQSPQLLPTPRPPALLITDVDPDDTGEVIEAFAADWHELVRAYLEAIGIIEANNAAR